MEISMTHFLNTEYPKSVTQTHEIRAFEMCEIFLPLTIAITFASILLGSVRFQHRQP